MEILLMRHGHAVEDAPGLGDAGRFLTGKGRRVTRRVAAWLAKSDARRPAAIWTSPLVRAVQTAEILAHAAELVDGVSVVAELSPGRALSDLVRLLSMHHGDAPLALVGHEPSLSLLASSLLGDAAAALRLKKAGVIALRWDGGDRATLRFILDPKEMRVSAQLPRSEREHA